MRSPKTSLARPKPSFETLLQTARECHQFLSEVGIAHVLIGGLAVRLYVREGDSRDVDLLVRPGDKDRVYRAFQGAKYRWRRGAYINPETNVRVDVRYAGEKAGIGDVHVVFPDPLACTKICNLPVLDLTHLIETKLACGLTHRKRD